MLDYQSMGSRQDCCGDITAISIMRRNHCSVHLTVASALTCLPNIGIVKRRKTRSRCEGRFQVLVC